MPRQFYEKLIDEETKLEETKLEETKVEETKVEETKDDNLTKLCEELNAFNNQLRTCGLSEQEIQTYVKTNLTEQANELKNTYAKEFKHLPLDNPLKQSIYILLVKLGILEQPLAYHPELYNVDPKSKATLIDELPKLDELRVSDC